MTKEEAIQILKRRRFYPNYSARLNEAIDMAIEALSAEYEDYEHATLVDIKEPLVKHDREWIIGCIKHDGFIKTDRFDKANQIILEALSAEPSEQYKKGFEDAKRAFELEYAREAESIRKRNAQLEVMLNAQKASSAEPSGDLISRADAIEAVAGAKAMDTFGRYDMQNIGIDWALKALNELPSADRPKGEWLDEHGDKVEFDDDGIPEDSCWCSVCGEWLVASDEYSTKGNFCPNCGADMRGEK